MAPYILNVGTVLRWSIAWTDHQPHSQWSGSLFQ